MSEICIMLCCVSACVYVALCACIGICFVVVSICVCVGSGMGAHIAAQGHAATACMCKPSAHQPLILYWSLLAFPSKSGASTAVGIWRMPLLWEWHCC